MQTATKNKKEIFPEKKSEKSPAPKSKAQIHFRENALLYTAASVAAFSAIAYELLLASYASFLLGATIFQYSIVISCMMASMGVGAYSTNRVRQNPYAVFLVVELCLALLSVVALPALYWGFYADFLPRLMILSFVCLIGFAIGTEIPLLNQMTKHEKGLPRILFFDYLGGFLGGLAFPLVLFPQLGFFRVAALLSCLNAGIAAVFFFNHRSKFTHRTGLWAAAVSAIVVVSLGFLFSAEKIRVAQERLLFGINETSR